MIDSAIFVQNLVVEPQRGVRAEVTAPVLCYHHIFGVRVREFAVVVGGSVPLAYIDFVVILALFVLLSGFDVLHRDRLIELAPIISTGIFLSTYVAWLTRLSCMSVGRTGGTFLSPLPPVLFVGFVCFLVAK